MNPSASSMQQSGHDQSVSSVIPFSAEDGDGLASRRSTVLLQMPDNSFAGPLHQDGTRDMRLHDGAAIECLHLGSGDDLHRWPCLRNRSRLGHRESVERKSCG